MANALRGKAMQWLLPAVAAFLSTISLTWMYGSALFLIGTSVLHLVLFAGLLWLYRKTLPYLQPRRAWVSLVGGGLLGVAQAAGTTVKIGAPVRAVIIMSPGYALLFGAVFCLLFAFLDNRAAHSGLESSATHPLLRRLETLLGGGRRQNLLLWGLVTLFWLPYLVLFWPGLVSLDVTVQMSMGLGIMPMTTHHPVIHSLYIANFMRLGKTLFGSYAMGVGMATTVQLLGTSFIITAALRKMEKLHISLGWRVAALGFYTLLPLVGWYSVTLWKDVWLASFTLLFALLVMEITWARQVFFTRWQNLLQMVLVSVGLVFSKNTGIYLFVLTVVVMAAVLKGCRRQLAVWFLLVVVLFKVVDGPVYRMLGIQHGDAREALSVPMLQIARVVATSGDGISPEDKELINRVLPYDELPALYDYRVSDSIKMHFNTEVFNQDKAAYLQLWLRLGLQNPREYIVSFLEQSFGYWYPDVQHWIFAYNTYPAELLDGGIDFNGLETRAGQYLQPFVAAQKNLLYAVATLRRIPVVSMLYSIGFYFWLLLAAALHSIYKKQYIRLLPMVLMVTVWLTCIASPVYAEFRYAYPAIISVPVMLGYSFGGAGTIPLNRRVNAMKSRGNTGEKGIETGN